MHFFEADAEGYIKYPGLTRFPSVLGHELAGDVVEVGKHVTHIKVGDPVTIEDMVRCGTCYACRINQPNFCDNLDEVGFSINGGFAEYVRVPARNCSSRCAHEERGRALRLRRDGRPTGRLQRAVVAAGGFSQAPMRWCTVVVISPSEASRCCAPVARRRFWCSR